MDFGKKTLRLDLAPLTVAVSLNTMSVGSPLAQTYVDGEYSPDRTLTPTVIVPEVVMNASDGSLASAYTNADLAELKWYVNDVEISTLSDWQGLYEVITEGEYKGGILIYRNVSLTERFALRLEAKVNDSRTNLNYTVVTDTVILFTLDVGEETYSLSVEEDTIIQYNQFKDPLYRREYEVSHGYDTTISEDAARNSCNSYLRTLNFKLYKGDGEYSGDWTLRVFNVNGMSDGILDTEEVTDTDESEFNVIGQSTEIDLRMVERQDYVARAYVNDEEVAYLQFVAARHCPKYDIKTLNGSDRHYNQTERSDKAVVTCYGYVLPYPTMLVTLVWKTSTISKEVTQGEGEVVTYTIESTGAGDTAADGYIDQWIESDHKPVHSVATDENGDVYADEDGNSFIIH